MFPIRPAVRALGLAWGALLFTGVGSAYGQTEPAGPLTGAYFAVYPVAVSSLGTPGHHSRFTEDNDWVRESRNPTGPGLAVAVGVPMDPRLGFSVMVTRRFAPMREEYSRTTTNQERFFEESSWDAAAIVSTWGGPIRIGGGVGFLVTTVRSRTENFGAVISEDANGAMKGLVLDVAGALPIRSGLALDLRLHGRYNQRTSYEGRTGSVIYEAGGPSLVAGVGIGWWSRDRFF
ncbi:MAG TPA: hypothetical protein VK929_16990 [Longimicrobiales bacterium]|nr:hypothetical protein [Longimicrobiales bacterium]